MVKKKIKEGGIEMKKELFIKVSLCVLMLTVALAPIFLASFISIWFLFGWVLVPFIVVLSMDYCENHNKSYFLNDDSYDVPNI